MFTDLYNKYNFRIFSHQKKQKETLTKKKFWKISIQKETPKEPQYPFAVIPTFPHSYQRLSAMMGVFSGSIDLPFWTFDMNVVCGLLWTAAFTWIIFFKVNPCSVCVRILLLIIAKQHSLIWIYHILLIHLSVDGHLGYLYFLTTIKTWCYKNLWITFCRLYLHLSWAFT